MASITCFIILGLASIHCGSLYPYQKLDHQDIAVIENEEDDQELNDYVFSADTAGKGVSKEVDKILQHVKNFNKNKTKSHSSPKTHETGEKYQNMASFEAAKEKKVKKEIENATKKKMLKKNKDIMDALKKIVPSIDKLAKKKAEKNKKVEPKV